MKGQATGAMDSGLGGASGLLGLPGCPLALCLPAQAVKSPQDRPPGEL